MFGIPIREMSVGDDFELGGYGNGKIIYIEPRGDYACVVVKFKKAYGRGGVVDGMMVTFQVEEFVH